MRHYPIRPDEIRTCKVCRKSFTFYACPSNKVIRAGLYCSRECYWKGKKRPLAERFKKFVGETTVTGCILWIGARQPNGYGHILGDDGKLLLAHRAAWILTYGSIRDDLHTLHTCDNPQCINVAHLFLGTNADNCQDKARKGRAPCGESHARSVLSEQAVRSIRSLYAAGGISQKKLAGQFGVSQSNISRILTRQDWAHVA